MFDIHISLPGWLAAIYLLHLLQSVINTACAWAGNPNMCGGIPSGIPVFEYLSGTDVSQVRASSQRLIATLCVGKTACHHTDSTSHASLSLAF